MADGRKEHKAQPDLSDTTNMTAITRTHRSYPASQEEVDGPFKGPPEPGRLMALLF